MRKIKIDVKLSFFANSIPTSNQSSGSDREFLFHISYLKIEKKKKGQKYNNLQGSLFVFLDNYYLFVR